MTFSVFSEEHYMQQAMEQAEMAMEQDEVPVGAVVVSQNQIIAKGYNISEKMNDFTAHAEMVALSAASEFLQSKYLEDCELYVTLEPCAMCAGALFLTRVKKVVFGAFDEKRGFTLFSPPILGLKTQVKGGILKEESSSLLKKFFSEKRES